MGRYSERCAQAKSIEQKTLTPKEKEELEKKQKRETLAKVAGILRKCETLRTPDETRFLEQCSDQVKKITDRKERREIYKERVQEKEDPQQVLEAKARKLADAIRRAKHLICYTGAGISTSAKIPDYRGSNGIWTLLAQGKSIGQHDLSLAEPTFTHMALFELHRRKMLRFVVSQNCDGLHLRSGLPRYSLSEVHGNMYVEACKNCKPNVEYWRLFDTTELTARYNHKTNRRCHLCGGPLVDTIVHFGERGTLKWPLNWAGACKQSEETDCILCLGSSLKVLKKYSWLWAMDRPVKKRPKLYIVNLQWTPKDSMAALKVNGKCDDVMRLVMQYLGIEVPAYRRERDPIFVHASMLCPEELHTVSQPMLKAQMEEEAETNGKVLKEETDEDEDSVSRRNSVSTEEVEPVTVKRNSPLDVMDLQKRLNRFEEEFQISRDSEESNGVKQEVKVEPKEDHSKDYLSKFMEKKRELEMSLPSTSKSQTSQQVSLKTVVKEERVEEGEHETKATITEAIKTLYKTEPSPPQSLEQKEGDSSSSASQEELQLRSMIASGIFGDFPSTSSTSTDYEDLLRIYQSLEATLPHWNNPKYAYSGLHSILLPPPPELNLWGSVVIPIIQPKVERRPPPPECGFCYENYSELVCQFYEPKKTEFLKVAERNGKPVVCECCDHSEGEEADAQESEEKQPKVLKVEAEEEEVQKSHRRTSNELNEISNKFNRNGSDGELGNVEGGEEPAEKVSKIEHDVDEGPEHQKENGTGPKAPVVVQAGWYGKGYRKYRQQRRRKS